MAAITSQSPLTPETFKPLIGKVFEKPPNFKREDASLAFEHLLNPASTTPAQIGSFLTALHLTGLERDPEILSGCAEVLRRVSVPVEVGEHKESRRVVDIVGTGGDGHNTFNVSTTAAIVAAGAGALVHKHGSRAATSSSGSADLLQALGCPLSSPEKTKLRVEAFNENPSFRFFLAPHYHPLLAPLAPIRKLLPHRTVLNLIGPLVNPARPRGMVLGVAHTSLGVTFSQALSKNETIEHAMVVCGAEHLDEISIAGPTSVWEFDRSEPVEKRLKEYTISPETFGLVSYPLSTVAGGKGPEENGETFKRLLREHPTPDDLKPVLNFVLINAAALLFVAGIAQDLPTGVNLARSSIDEGKAWDAFEAFREFDNGANEM